MAKLFALEAERTLIENRKLLKANGTFADNIWLNLADNLVTHSHVCFAQSTVNQLYIVLLVLNKYAYY